MEFENVKDALKFAVKVARADCNVKVDGKSATVRDLQDLIIEPLCSIADMLGLSEVYQDK